MSEAYSRAFEFLPTLIVQGIAVLTAVISEGLRQGGLTQEESDACISAMSIMGALGPMFEPHECYYIMCHAAEARDGLKKIWDDEAARIAEIGHPAP